MSTYSNPIAAGGDFADPFVLRHDGRYYLYATNPGVPCWSSTDLVSWTPEGATVPDGALGDLVPFAPEVTYSAGFFYMYTSPSGTGHRVLRSASPTGPFEPVTGNIGLAIDGNVLIDDDGTWYFYWAGDEGIWAAPMLSPTEVGEPVLTGVTMHGWTEGPFVMKHDGRYHMTLTGNHYLSPGYRIDVAVSDDPLRGWTTSPHSPVLVSTRGDHVGLGHSSTVLGPDLVSRYLVFHNLNPDESRDLNIDRQVWNGDVLDVLGPSRLAPHPAAPDAQERWCSTQAWDVVSGSLTVCGDVDTSEGATLTGEPGVALWRTEPWGTSFTTELWWRTPSDDAQSDDGASGSGAYGVLAHDDGGRELWRLRLTATQLELVSEGVVRASATLGPGHLAEALHSLRLAVSGGTLTAWLGSRRLLTSEVAADDVARLGVLAEGTAVHLGHVAATRSTEELASRHAVKPVPGRFAAAHCAGPVVTVPAADGLRRELLRLAPGGRASFELIVAAAGPHHVLLTGDLAPGADLELRVEDAVVGRAAGEGRVAASVVELPAGAVTLEVVASGAEARLDTVAVARVETEELTEPLGRAAGPLLTAGDELSPCQEVVATRAFVRGEPVRLEGPAKIVLPGTHGHTMEVRAELEVDHREPGGHGDLLLRADQLAEGWEGADRVLGVNFLLGYSVQLHAEEVVLARHAYDEVVLARAPLAHAVGGARRVVVARLRGDELEVEVDGAVLLKHRDAHPHLLGFVGLRAWGAALTAEVSLAG